MGETGSYSAVTVSALRRKKDCQNIMWRSLLIRSSESTLWVGGINNDHFAWETMFSEQVWRWNRLFEQWNDVEAHWVKPVDILSKIFIDPFTFWRQNIFALRIGSVAVLAANAECCPITNKTVWEIVGLTRHIVTSPSPNAFKLYIPAKNLKKRRFWGVHTCIHLWFLTIAQIVSHRFISDV